MLLPPAWQVVSWLWQRWRRLMLCLHDCTTRAQTLLAEACCTVALLTVLCELLLPRVSGVFTRAPEHRFSELVLTQCWVLWFGTSCKLHITISHRLLKPNYDYLHHRWYCFDPRLSVFFMVTLCNRADHIYFHAVSSFFLLFLFPRLISAVRDWMSTILPHMVWPWCEFRMQVWNVLHVARWKYRTQKWCKKSPSGHHPTTLSGYIFATKACIDNRKKTC